MSSNYIQFCTTLIPQNDVELAWWQKYLPLVSLEGIDDNSQLLKALSKECKTPHCMDAYNEIFEAAYQGLSGPEADIEDSVIYFYCRDNCEVFGHIIALVNIYQNLFEVTKPWSLMWANTSSDMTPDGFGGGAVVVSRNSVVYLDMFEWVQTTSDDLSG